MFEWKTGLCEMISGFELMLKENRDGRSTESLAHKYFCWISARSFKPKIFFFISLIINVVKSAEIENHNEHIHSHKHQAPGPLYVMGCEIQRT